MLNPYKDYVFIYFDVFLINFIGKILQIRLKTHQLITKAIFCVFCDQGVIFK